MCSAVLPGLLLLVPLLLPQSTTAGEVDLESSSRLSCVNESSQLFPLDIELLDGTGAILFSSAAGKRSGATKICYGYPFAEENLGSKFATAWQSFRDLRTVQYVLPASLANAGVATIRIIATGNASSSFVSYYQAEHSDSLRGIAAHSYPSPGSTSGDPIHASIFQTDANSCQDGCKANGGSIMALWVSFNEPEAAYDCAHYDHCCIVSDDIAEGLDTGTCEIAAPSWGCHTPGNKEWTQGEAVGFINYYGGLARSAMAAGGKSLLVHLEPTADISVPLTNSYAEHAVQDSAACRELCSSIAATPQILDLWGDHNAHSCQLTQPPSIKAKAGYGAITVNGFGRINGQLMMRNFSFQGQANMWSNPKLTANAGFTNAYGNMVQKMTTIANTQSHTRWRIHSGLLELSSAGKGTSEVPDNFAVSVRGVTVGWSPKRGDGPIRLQFPRVPLDGGHKVSDSNVAARLYDIKTPGTWVGASDGPRVVADNSSLAFLYLQHADDNLKMDSSYATYRCITLLQGNIGSAIELGTYGIGLRGNRVEHSLMENIFVHRITHFDNQEDNLGSLLGSRTCPIGVVLKNLTLANVVVPSVSGVNQVSSLFALGTYGQQNLTYASDSPLDRWSFCQNSWWLGCGNQVSGKVHNIYQVEAGCVCLALTPSWLEQGDGNCNQILHEGQAALLSNIRILNWQVHVTPSEKSKLYNFHTHASTTFDTISFYENFDESAVAKPGGYAFPWTSATRLFADDKDLSFRTPCLGVWAGDSNGERCWMRSQSEQGNVYSGQILARARYGVCNSTGQTRKAEGKGPDCNTFALQGDKATTTFLNLRFPFGNGTDYIPGLGEDIRS